MGSGRVRLFTKVFRSRPGLRLRWLASVVVLSLAATMADAAAIRPPAEAVSPVDAPQRQVGPAEPLERGDERAALITARIAKQRVEVTGYRSETRRVYANPDGSLTAEASVLPRWTRRPDGSWVDVDPTLVRGADGSIRTAATPVDVRLSIGGAGPLVTIQDQGKALSVSWPGTLPAPRLDGPDAVYPDVLPDVDLVVRASSVGISQVLVVKTAAAARLPQLRQLRLPTAGAGLRLVSDATGGLRAVDARGGTVFAAPSPQMWDSSGPPPAGSEDSLTPGRAVRPSFAPGARARTAAVHATVSGGTVVLAPDAGLLGAADVQYPVYIDPSWSSIRWYTVNVSNGAPTTNYFNQNPMKVGTLTGGTAKWRSFAVFDLAGVVGRYPETATLSAWNNYAPSCTATPMELWHVTGGIGTSTTWNSQPTWVSPPLATQSFARGFNSTCPAANVYLEATRAVRNALEIGYTTVGFGMKAQSETTNAQYKQFYQGNVTLTVTYSDRPTVANPSTVPATQCVAGAGRPFINTTTPTLRAVVSDPDQQALSATFAWTAVGGGALLGSQTVPNLTSGQTAEMVMPSGQLFHGFDYMWRVRASDGRLVGPYSPWCEFTVDNIAPGPATVASTDYPQNGWAKGAGQAGTFTFTANGTSDVAAYVYGLDTTQPTQVVNAASLGGNASVQIVPPSDGPHTLYVRSRDRAGNLGTQVAYRFNVGIGGVTSPKLGDITAGRSPSAGRHPRRRPR